LLSATTATIRGQSEENMPLYISQTYRRCSGCSSGWFTNDATTSRGSGQQATLPGDAGAEPVVRAVAGGDEDRQHLARIGAGQDAPCEVVGSRDTTLTIDRPAYATKIASPVTVGGRISGVDESILVQVRQPSSERPIGSAPGVPAAARTNRGPPASASAAQPAQP
jgi:hypothetical protein